MRVLHLDLVKLPPRLVQLLPVGPLCYFPDDVSGSTIVQGLLAPLAMCSSREYWCCSSSSPSWTRQKGLSGKSQAEGSTFHHVASRLGPASG